MVCFLEDGKTVAEGICTIGHQPKDISNFLSISSFIWLQVLDPYLGPEEKYERICNIVLQDNAPHQKD